MSTTPPTPGTGRDRGLDAVTDDPMPAASVRDLHVELPSRDRPNAAPLHAVRGLTFTAPAGQVTALVGANGAGKTTALRALTGAVPFTAGLVEVLRTAMGPAEVASPAGVSFVPDAPAYPGHWTARHVARLRRSLVPGFDERCFERYLTDQRVPMARDVHELSRGQLAQLGVAAALAEDPLLLILDEPLARLDPLARTDLVDELRTVMTRDDRTILLATHDLEGMDRFVDRLVVIAQGKAVLEGDVESLRDEFLLLEQPTTSPDLPGVGSPLIGATAVGGTMRALVHVEDAMGLPPDTDLRRPGLTDVVTHWLRATSASGSPTRRTVT